MASSCARAINELGIGSNATGNNLLSIRSAGIRTTPLADPSKSIGTFIVGSSSINHGSGRDPNVFFMNSASPVVFVRNPSACAKRSSSQRSSSAV